MRVVVVVDVVVVGVIALAVAGRYVRESTPKSMRVVVGVDVVVGVAVVDVDVVVVGGVVLGVAGCPIDSIKARRSTTSAIGMLCVGCIAFTVLGTSLAQIQTTQIGRSWFRSESGCVAVALRRWR